jgi:Na+-transporting NADH:ubiquinone oxidoreductase subunit D
MPSKSLTVFKTGLWDDNPVFRQILGICSTLAVTNRLVNTAVMCIGLIYTMILSSLTVSLLRNVTPRRIRMMVEVLIIAAYVIVLKLFLEAFLPDISRELGAYVGLIITNCIVMGRCEAYAGQNGPWESIWDALGCSVGYSFVLLFIAFFRELLGFGTLFGLPVLTGDWTYWTIMVMPPGAFFMLAIAVWLARSIAPSKAGQGGKTK